MSGTPHDDGGGAPSAAELAALRGDLDELRQAFAQLQKASTPDERRQARDRVDDAEEDFEQTAKRLGVSPAKLRESIEAARKAERRDELRPLLEELLDELIDDDDDEPALDDDAGDKAKPGKRGGKGAGKGKAAAPAAGADGDDGSDAGTPPAADTEPVRPHWSETAVGSLLR